MTVSLQVILYRGSEINQEIYIEIINYKIIYAP
ncbi:hypothetical protein YPPY54_4693, partial [Yersinia pestis PY-54]